MHTPLILTLQLDEASQSFFNEKRKQYFPPDRNFLSAHLTLFHHLPDDESVIMQTLEALCLQQKRMEMITTELKNIGQGAAYKIESKQLILLHKTLHKEWFAFLTPQDKQGLWPHITIQNKVSAEEAGRTAQEIRKSFTPFTVYATGLILWRYLSGPWQWYRQFPFGG